MNTVSTHSRQARCITRWFGLTGAQCPTPYRLPSTAIAQLIPRPGQILLITGPSGSGKSNLIQQFSEAIGRARRIDLNALRYPDRLVVECFGRTGLTRVLELLSRVGLAEVWSYLRKPMELSEGQRWRLRLAMGLARMKPKRDSVLIADEFCATLDRVTAAVVSRALRKVITETAGRAVVATSADDLVLSLRPDRQIECDFECVRIDQPAARG